MRIEFQPSAVWEKALDRIATDRLDELGQEVKERAKQRVHKRSGQLAASIRVERVHDEKGRTEVRVVADEFYARFVELGTVHARPYPFLRPALAFIRRSGGGKHSGISTARQTRRFKAQSKANRDAAKARRAGG